MSRILRLSIVKSSISWVSWRIIPVTFSSWSMTDKCPWLISPHFAAYIPSMNGLQLHLVGGLEHEFYFFHSVRYSNPNWRTHIIFRGVAQPPTRYGILWWLTRCWVGWSTLVLVLSSTLVFQNAHIYFTGIVLSYNMLLFVITSWNFRC